MAQEPKPTPTTAAPPPGYTHTNDLHSANEPPGSDIASGGPGGELPGGGTGGETQPLSLDSISPEILPLQPDTITSVNITATGTGFTAATVMIFDDEEVPTTLISSTSLRGAVPTIDIAGVYDVELQRGEDLSDVLEFEFVDAHANESKVVKKPTARKPAKAKDAPRKKAKGKK